MITKIRKIHGLTKKTKPELPKLDILEGSCKFCSKTVSIHFLNKNNICDSCVGWYSKNNNPIFAEIYGGTKTGRFSASKPNYSDIPRFNRVCNKCKKLLDSSELCDTCFGDIPF